MTQTTSESIDGLAYKHCPGTRQPVEGCTKAVTAQRSPYYYASQCGRGRCSICAKVVTCHKDKTAVRHKDGRP